jgi:hypothetical protein
MTARTAKKTTTAAPKPAAKKTTAKRPGVAAQEKAVKSMVPAKKATKAEPKKPVDFESRDWTYLQDKDPSDLHVTFAKAISQRADVEISAQQVQAVLAMHASFQRSKLNKSRPTYVALDEVIVKQRSVHMTQAHLDAAAEMAARGPKPTKKATAKKAPAKKAAAKKTTARKAS